MTRLQSVEICDAYVNQLGRVVIKLGGTELVGLEPEKAEEFAQTILRLSLRARQVRLVNMK